MVFSVPAEIQTNHLLNESLSIITTPIHLALYGVKIQKIAI